MARKRQIGIYIGAFDPIHNGHLNFAAESISSGYLDQVYFLVEPKPRLSQGVKAYDHRVNMSVIATKAILGLGVIVIKDGSYSFDEVIPLLTSRFGAEHLTILLTENSLTQIIKWPWLKMGDQTFNLLVGLKNQTTSEVRGQIQLLKDVTSLKIKLNTFSLIGEMPQSSDLKAQLKDGNRPNSIPEPVFEYIKEKKLYVSDKA